MALRSERPWREARRTGDAACRPALRPLSMQLRAAEDAELTETPVSACSGVLGGSFPSKELTPDQEGRTPAGTRLGSRRVTSVTMSTTSVAMRTTPTRRNIQ